MEYYVYENWTHKKAIIHKGNCSFCNSGQGIHLNSSEKNGHWLGPFKNKQEAESVAYGIKKKLVSNCLKCPSDK